MSDLDNSEVVKIISNDAKEFNELSVKFKELMEVHLKTVNDCAEIEAKRYELRKQNKDLRALVVRFERDNQRLQESLDGAQREIERLIERIEKHLDMSELMEEEGYMG